MASSIRVNERFLPPDLKQDAEAMLAPARGFLRELASRSPGHYDHAWTGFWHWPSRHGYKLQKAIAAWISSLDVHYDTVILVGIGGSYLGARAVHEALTPAYTHWRRNPGIPLLHAGHNLSESEALDLLAILDERRPIINVVSKSGTTTEPAVAFRVLRDYLERRFGKAEAAKRIVATTDGKKGALRNLAAENHYQCFEVPDDIGGRYSVLTAVGLVPLALVGHDTKALLDGADLVFQELDQAGADNGNAAALQYAAARMAAWRAGKRIEVLATAEPRLAMLAEWWKQLYGESEGKSGLGLFPAAVGYTADLHSLGQYLQEGPRHMLETFLHLEKPLQEAGREQRLKVPKAGNNLDELAYLEGRYINDINQAAMLGTMVAHADGGVPSIALGLNELTPRTVGELIAFFEAACAISAGLLGVNPFDQPGVEAYKKNLFGLLGKPGFEALGSALRKRL